MTSKIFGFVERKKMAEFMVERKVKEELTQIIEQDKISVSIENEFVQTVCTN